MSDYQQLELDVIKEKIAGFAAFSLGKETVMAMTPNFSKLTVERDLQRVKQALGVVVFNGGFSFSGMKDLRQPLSKADKQAILSVQEIVDIGLFIRGTLLIQSELLKLEVPHDSLDDLIESLESDMNLAVQIERCFSPNYEVLDSASSLLSSLRRQLREMDQRVSVQMQKFLEANKESLSQQATTQRHQRNVVMVKPSEKNKISGMVHGASSSGQTIYIEPDFMIRLNNEQQALQQAIDDEIERICIELSARISQVAFQLSANLETAALLDSIFAKAKWGFSRDGVVAELSDDSLELVKARHPLIDPKTVVANSYHLVPPYRMIIITGPNTGGKSVALKTMGLFTLLTLCGCPVIAEKATVMMVDHVFVDIGDQQSITQSLSTFSGHLSQISRITAQATSKSLVLLDELGGGTDPQEGESLAIAILDYLRQKRSYVIATTHYSALKSYASKHAEILSASVGFDIETLKPTYRYLENLTGSSYAFEIAAKLNVDTSIIEAAKTIKEENRSEQDRLIQTLEQQKTLLNQELEDAEILKQTLDEQRMQFERERRQFQDSLEKQRETVASEGRAYLEKMELEVKNILETLKQAHKPHEIQQQMTRFNALEPEIMDTRTIDESLQVGDSVRILKSQQIGTIESIEKNKASVHVGNLSVKVNLKELQKVSKPKSKKAKVRSFSVTALSKPKLECNVIGMHVEEALQTVAKYLDDCVIHHLNQVRIVHGHGTGALRTAIHDQLRHNKNVKSFRLGGQGEGGVGATVVTLNDE